LIGIPVFFLWKRNSHTRTQQEAVRMRRRRQMIMHCWMLYFSVHLVDALYPGLSCRNELFLQRSPPIQPAFERVPLMKETNWAVLFLTYKAFDSSTNMAAKGKSGNGCFIMVLVSYPGEHGCLCFRSWLHQTSFGEKT
jgi:hypothetical protein